MIGLRSLEQSLHHHRPLKGNRTHNNYVSVEMYRIYRVRRRRRRFFANICERKGGRRTDDDLFVYDINLWLILSHESVAPTHLADRETNSQQRQTA